MKEKSNLPVFLSIIVVTWNNENFIEQAVLSCIDEELDNYEVVVVHNASEDRTGELLQRCYHKYPDKIRIIENEKNEGLGEGRNIGLKNAKGEYLVFLDGDDYFEPGALKQVCEKLQDKKPDVLMYDYQRVWDTGWKQVNRLNHLLCEHDASAADRRKDILEVFNIACNKAYRRQFIESEGIKFSDGYYEDIAWTYSILLTARSIYTIPLIVLNYRQRQGSILKSTDERHLILPDRYQELLAIFYQKPELVGLYGKTMHDIARAHLFARPVWPRLPARVRRHYLKRTAEVLEQWRELCGIKKSDKTLKVAKLGIPFLYSFGKKVAPLKKNIHKRLRKLLLFIYRNVFCFFPINKNKVYLESYWGTKLDCNPLYLAKYLKENKNYKVIFGYKKESNFTKDSDFEYVRIGSVKYWFTVATSHILINNANLRTEVIKRKGSIHIQTQHGTPLKKMGIDNRGNPNVKMNWRNFAKRCSRWDYVISSNPYSSMIWRRAMPYTYEIIETGYPRNDVFFQSNQIKIDQIKKELNIDSNKKIALYAPTFRDNSNFEGEFPLPFDAFYNSLGDDYIVLVRSHYFYDKFKNISKNIIDVSSYPHTNDLCLISDILITDYSSIMFDYACLKRPIILYIPDYEQYIEDRGVYFDIRAEAPGAVAETLPDLKDILKSKIYLSDENTQKLLRFNEKFCPWDDGHASKRVWEKVLNKSFDN